MNSFTLTDDEEYLAGVLTKHPECVRFATTSSIFLADLTGLAGADLCCLELGTRFELECFGLIKQGFIRIQSRVFSLSQDRFDDLHR